jgi:DHA1 family multidrug resistance protein-like MFS transporter
LQELSWRALSALMLAMFAVSVGYSIVLPILPFMIERLVGTTDPATLSRHTGLLTGTYVLAIFLFAPFWGKVSDRQARRPVILLGLVGLAVTLGLFALFKSLPLLYLGRFLDGLFAAAIAPAAYALVGDHAPSKEWRAYRFTLLNVAATAGFFVGPLLAGLVLRASRELTPGVDDEFFAAPFFAASALALMAALIALGLMSEAGPRCTTQDATINKPDKRAIMLRLGAIALVGTFAIGAFEVGLSLRGKLILGMDSYQIGMMFAECSIVMLVAQVVVFSPLLKPDITRWLLTPGLVVLALGLALVPFASGYIATTVAVALVAASAGILSPIVTYWVSLRAGETEGADLGWVTAAASLGQVLGSAAGGLLFNVSIFPNAAFNIAGLVVLAGIAASLGLPRLLAQQRDAGGADALAEPNSIPSAHHIAAEAAPRARRHPHEHG